MLKRMIFSENQKMGRQKNSAREKRGRVGISVPGIIIAALLAAGLFIGTACAVDTSAGALVSAGENVYVSSVSYDPAIFFTGDAGTVTYSVTNGNANESISVNHATFGDNNIRRTSGTYDTTASIGPLQTRDYTFTVVADASDGIYYPRFSVSYFGSMSLWHQANIQVDNTPLVLLIADKPDSFTQGTKDTISVQIANPRKNDEKNVILRVSGTGLDINPSTIFVGNLASGKSTTVNFSVTPESESTMSLELDYNNGDNVHTVSATLPIVFSTDKKQADPIISNVEVTKEGNAYTVTGDITNAGLLTANAVTVTSLSPAIPKDPYRSYIIGALKQDDFGSFTLTFTADDAESVPLQLSYKDKDGNVITSRQDVSLAGAKSSQQSSGGPGIVPVLAVIIVMCLGAGGYLFMKKKKRL